ncbi:MAG: ribosome maturation factor RimP [Rhodospirillales bacterium]|nr:ribosome maturation factor RimP [Rhodospirillales bacterium]
MADLSNDERDLRKSNGGLADEVERLIGPALDDLGYAVVRVIFGGEQQARLQVMIEQADGCSIDVEDCAKASRAIEAILDVEDPIRTHYLFEVSSPGIDRPLTRLKDFSRYAGHLARLELAEPLAGRRRFSGTLLGVEGSTILLETEEGRVSLDFIRLAKAKLVLTDALIAEHRAAAAAEKEGKSG